MYTLHVMNVLPVYGTIVIITQNCNGDTDTGYLYIYQYQLNNS